MSLENVAVAASCWPDWSCSWPEWSCGSETFESGSSLLKGRVCPEWRIVPGMLALVACIVGVAVSLLWQVDELCYVFGPGAACSGYLMYLGWDFQNLQTFSENNEIYVAENTKLRGTVSDLEKTQISLEDQVRELETLKAQMMQNLDESQKSMNGIYEGLRQVRQLTAQDQESMGSKLMQLDGSAQSVSDTAQKLDDFKSKMETNASALSTVGMLLQESVQTIGELLNKDAIKERLSHLNDLSAKEREMYKNLAALQGQLGALQGQHTAQLQQLNETNSSLQKTRLELDSTKDELAGQVSNLGKLVDKIDQRK